MLFILSAVFTCCTKVTTSTEAATCCTTSARETADTEFTCIYNHNMCLVTHNGTMCGLRSACDILQRMLVNCFAAAAATPVCIDCFRSMHAVVNLHMLVRVVFAQYNTLRAALVLYVVAGVLYDITLYEPL
jgi:hypothetical protein